MVISVVKKGQNCGFSVLKKGWFLGWLKRKALVVITVVKKAQFWVVISAVKKGQFFVVISVVNKGAVLGGI